MTSTHHDHLADHKDHHHNSAHHQLTYVVEAGNHAMTHLAKKTPEDRAIAKDIIGHLISSVSALEAHAEHL